MKNFFLTVMSLFLISSIYAQVGVNTETPATTLHVLPTRTDGATAEGIIAPNLKRSEVIAKDSRYTALQTGAMIYVSDLSGTLTTKTAKITSTGYYYFDGTLWQPFTNGAMGTVTDANNGLTMSGTTVQLGGALTAATNITGGNRLTLATPTTVSGTLQVSSGTPGTGKVLTSDATGNASWTALPAAPAPTVTTANNGLTMNGTTAQLGGALTAATNITGTSRLTLATPTTVSGALQVSSGTPGTGKVLTSDATGNASWVAPSVTTANNGLTMNGTTTQLGGALIKTTTINADTYDLNVSGTATMRIQPKTTIGSTIAPPAGSILNLQTQADLSPSTGGVNANGGLSMPRVQLLLANSLQPFVASPTSAQDKAHKGMTVYHIGGNSMDAGVYVWNGATWMRLLDKLPTNSARIFYLAKDALSGYTSATNYDSMTTLSFSENLSTLAPSIITLPEAGSYAFAIRLFQRYMNKDNPAETISTAPAGTAGSKIIMYVAIFIGNVCKDIQILNGTITPFVANSTLRNDNTITSILSLTGNEGDQVTIKFGSYHPYSEFVMNSKTYYPCALAYPAGKVTTDATNLIFWKL